LQSKPKSLSKFWAKTFRQRMVTFQNKKCIE
jgi:hypothetical protein